MEYILNNSRWQQNYDLPDPPSRHHLPFDRLMALSKTEGLAAPYI
jgi:hypothetical protein